MKRCILYIIELMLISVFLLGCGIINTVSNSMTITTPNGDKIEIEDEETQDKYLAIFKNKQKIEKKPGYLSIKNKYTVDYEKDGQQGTFEFYIEPSLIEVMIDFNKATTEDIVYTVENILSVTELELEDLVFKDSFGLLLDAEFYPRNTGRTIGFEYSTDGPFRVANSNVPSPSGVAFSTTSSKMTAWKTVANQLMNSCDFIGQIEYNEYNYPKTPEAIIPHLYKSFVMDDSGNWYRISDSNICFLITQEEIYDSIKKEF